MILEKYFTTICFIVKKHYPMEAMPTQELIFYTNIKLLINRFDVPTTKKLCSAGNSFAKTFITPCKSKKWCYGYIIVAQVLTICVKNVSTICRYISLLINFNDFYSYNLFSSSKDFLKCYQSPIKFDLTLI